MTNEEIELSSQTLLLVSKREGVILANAKNNSEREITVSIESATLNGYKVPVVEQFFITLKPGETQQIDAKVVLPSSGIFSFDSEVGGIKDLQAVINLNTRSMATRADYDALPEWST